MDKAMHATTTGTKSVSTAFSSWLHQINAVHDKLVTKPHPLLASIYGNSTSIDDPNTQRGVFAQTDIKAGDIMATIPFLACPSPTSFLLLRSREVILSTVSNTKAYSSDADVALLHWDELCPPVEFIMNELSEFLDSGKEISLIELRHLFLAAHLAATRRIVSRVSSSQPVLWHDPLIKYLPTSTAAHATAAKSAARKLPTNEMKEALLNLTLSHRDLIKAFRKVCQRWSKMKQRTYMSKNSVTSYALSTAELSWAMHIVHSYSILVPADGSVTAPDDVETWVDLHPNASVTPAIIPLVSFINHGDASDKKVNANRTPTPTLFSLGSSNAALLISRRPLEASTVEQVPLGQIRKIIQSESKESNVKSSGSEQNFTETRLFPEEAICRTVFVLLATADITAGDEVLIEYDLSDPVASVFRYGFF